MVTKYCANADYIDCFSVSVYTTNKILLEDIICISLFGTKSWVKALFVLRNLLVKPFGLQVGSIPEKWDNNRIKSNLKIGNYISFFKICDLSTNEILLEASDKHLQAWLSIHIKTENKVKVISTSTIVKYSNFLGKAYFFVIKPFHVLIMKSKMKKVVREICYRKTEGIKTLLILI